MKDLIITSRLLDKNFISIRDIQICFGCSIEGAEYCLDTIIAYAIENSMPYNESCVSSQAFFNYFMDHSFSKMKKYVKEVM